MRFIVNRKRYDTETSEVLATNQQYNSTRWRTLYRTKKGAHFVVNYTHWQGETDRAHPLCEEEAAQVYEELIHHEVEWEEAFPNVPLEEA